jgi:hypothetical protein
MKTIISFVLILIVTNVTGQSSLVMNGGAIHLRNGSYLVINNSQPAGITVLNTTNGIMNDAGSFIRWNIGTTAASYTVPFYFGGSYIPLSFTTSSASGAGYFDLNTNNVPNWKNSDYLPAGVTNVNRNGVDNSNHLIDRFWSISPQGYTQKPAITNLVFSYRDGEWNGAGNTIIEASLKGQRWNSTQSRWDDFPPAGLANTTLNTVTLSSVSPGDMFQWWTLVDAAFPLPLELLSFKAYLHEKKVKLDWTTTAEVDTKEFMVQRSSDRDNFRAIDTVAAAGNSTVPKNYSVIDADPLRGVSYYRLKMIDIDGEYTYSPIVLIVHSGNKILVYPNPVSDRINVNLGMTKATSFTLFDASGKILKTGSIPATEFSIEIPGFPTGTYLLRLVTDNGIKSLVILKQ